MSPRLPLTIIISFLTTVPPTANGATTLLLPNGSECSESRQCQSGCCVWNPFANEVCDKDSWFRRCMDDDYTFQNVETGSADTVCGSAVVEEASDASNTTAATTEQGTASIKVMTYNLYLILLASDGISSLDDRAKQITDWFANPEANQYDIIALQETWTNPIEVRDGMVAAGYCHYAYDDRGSTGSGLALYSKHPIVYHDFRGFQNACGGVDCVADKGVLYTKIAIPKSDSGDAAAEEDDKIVHVFNTHTMFSVDNHDVRRRQYNVMRTFINEQTIDPSELVLLVGDFNEDKINTPKKYGAMLNLLDAGEFALDDGGGLFSYDPDNNSLIDPDSAGAGSTQRALDYILYDKSALEPGLDSACQYIQPRDENRDLSDHYPMSCDITEAVTSIVPLSAKAETSDGKNNNISTAFVVLLGVSSVILLRNLLGLDD